MCHHFPIFFELFFIIARCVFCLFPPFYVNLLKYQLYDFLDRKLYLESKKLFLKKLHQTGFVIDYLGRSYNIMFGLVSKLLFLCRLFCNLCHRLF